MLLGAFLKSDPAARFTEDKRACRNAGDGDEGAGTRAGPAGGLARLFAMPKSHSAGLSAKRPVRVLSRTIPIRNGWVMDGRSARCVCEGLEEAA